MLNADARKRFVQAAAPLDHPHFVQSYKADDDDPVPFIADAHCSGPTLAVWLKEHGWMSPHLAAAMLIRLADAVEYCHQRGILHRGRGPLPILG